MRARTWQKLAEFYSAPGFTDELMHTSPPTWRRRRRTAAWGLTRTSDSSWSGVHGPRRSQPLSAARLRCPSIVGLFWLERHRHVRSGVVVSPHRPAGQGLSTDAVRSPYGLTVGEAVQATVGLTRRSTAIRLLGLLTIVVEALAALAGDVLSIIGVIIGLGLVTGWVAALLAWWQFRPAARTSVARTT